MNNPSESSNSNSDNTAVRAESVPEGKRSGALLATLLILILLAGGIGTFVAWKFWQEFETKILGTAADTIALEERQRQLAIELQRLRDDLVSKQQLQDVAERTARAQVQLSDRLAEIERAVIELQETAGGGNASYARAAARYLVQIANDELVLRGNIESALYALRAADARLQNSNVGFDNVRASLAADILALEAIANPDITGMALTLTSLANAVDSFPLRQVDAPAINQEQLPADAGAWQKFKSATRRLFNNVVTVRHDADPRPFVTPGQEYFLLRNLELKLESTRLSLLLGDAENFHAGAEASLQWLNRYFDVDDPAVAAALGRLQQFRDTALPATYPDLSNTLRLLEAGEH